MAKRCYYETLSVERTATDSDIKAAFRKQAMQCHPDRNPGDNDAEHRFKEINEAYEVLKDADKRAAYDRFGHAAFEQGGVGGGARLRRRLRHDLLRHLRRSVRHGRPARPRLAAASAAPTCATIWKSRCEEAYRGQDRADPHSDLGHLRGLLRHRRQARHQAEGLPDVRRPGQGPPRAGLLHARAHLPELPGPRPGDRRARARRARGSGRVTRERTLVGEHSAGRRGRHPHPARRRRRGRRARRPAGRSLHLPVDRRAPVLPARRRRSALPRAGLDGDGGARRRVRSADHRRRQDAR